MEKEHTVGELRNIIYLLESGNYLGLIEYYRGLGVIGDVIRISELVVLMPIGQKKAGKLLRDAGYEVKYSGEMTDIDYMRR